MARTPFYGRTPAPQIARMDMQSATAPGRFLQQSLTQLGQSIGYAITKNAENKEKKANQELVYNFLRKQGLSDEEATVGSKVPEASNFIMNMKKFESDQKTAQVNRENVQSQTQINQANLQNAEKAEKDQSELNRFMVTPSERMPTKAEGRYSVLQNLREGKGVTPPARMVKEDSFGVSQLPETYKKFGRDVEKAVQEGRVSPDVGAKLINEKRAEAMSVMSQGLQLTPGEEQLDKAFADDLIEFNQADVEKGLSQLNEAVTELEKKDNITGPIVSLMPDFLESKVNPDATQVREAVEEVVQRNLRLVLGSQFTEKEGERLIKRAFNPSLDESENKKRVERLIKSIRTALDEKLRQRSYFSAYGTLKGYRYTPYSYAQLEKDMVGNGKQTPVADDAPATEDSIKRLEELKKQARQRRGR